MKNEGIEVWSTGKQKCVKIKFAFCYWNDGKWHCCSVELRVRAATTRKCAGRLFRTNWLRSPAILPFSFREEAISVESEQQIRKNRWIKLEGDVLAIKRLPGINHFSTQAADALVGPTLEYLGRLRHDLCDPVHAIGRLFTTGRPSAFPIVERYV